MTSLIHLHMHILPCLRKSSPLESFDALLGLLLHLPCGGRLDWIFGSCISVENFSSFLHQQEKIQQYLFSLVADIQIFNSGQVYLELPCMSIVQCALCNYMSGAKNEDKDVARFSTIIFFKDVARLSTLIFVKDVARFSTIIFWPKTKIWSSAPCSQNQDLNSDWKIKQISPWNENKTKLTILSKSKLK